MIVVIGFCLLFIYLLLCELICLVLGKGQENAMNLQFLSFLQKIWIWVCSVLFFYVPIFQALSDLLWKFCRFIFCIFLCGIIVQVSLVYYLFLNLEFIYLFF